MKAPVTASCVPFVRMWSSVLENVVVVLEVVVSVAVLAVVESSCFGLTVGKFFLCLVSRSLTGFVQLWAVSQSRM